VTRIYAAFLLAFFLYGGLILWMFYDIGVFPK
jgi:hypothetical protein